MNTPWGYAQHQHKITDGVYEVSTAGHGGILVRADVASNLLSPDAIAKGWLWNGREYSYEEDCDWAIFAYEQPHLYAEALNREYRRGGGFSRGHEVTAERYKQLAYECLTRWHTDYLDARGIPYEKEVAS